MNFMNYLILCLVLTGCSTTRFAKLGPDTYLVQRKAGTGYSSASGLKMDALEAAEERCKSMNKELLVLSTDEKSVSFASTPSSDIQFRCLDASDPEFKRPTLEPSASTKIEIQNK